MMELIAAGLLGVLASVVAAELMSFLPLLANFAKNAAIERLRPDPDLAERLDEEWQAHLEACPGGLSKLLAALGFLLASSRFPAEAATSQAETRSTDETAEAKENSTPSIATTRSEEVGPSADARPLQEGSRQWADIDVLAGERLARQLFDIDRVPRKATETLSGERLTRLLFDSDRIARETAGMLAGERLARQLFDIDRVAQEAAKLDAPIRDWLASQQRTEHAYRDWLSSTQRTDLALCDLIASEDARWAAQNVLWLKSGGRVRTILERHLRRPDE